MHYWNGVLPLNKRVIVALLHYTLFMSKRVIAILIQIFFKELFTKYILLFLFDTAFKKFQGKIWYPCIRAEEPLYVMLAS